MNLTTLPVDILDLILCSLNSVADLNNLLVACHTTLLHDTFRGRESSIIGRVFENQFSDWYLTARLVLVLYMLSDQELHAIDEEDEDDDLLEKNLYRKDLRTIDELYSNLWDAAALYKHVYSDGKEATFTEWSRFGPALLSYAIYCRFHSIGLGLSDLTEDPTVLIRMKSVYDFCRHIARHNHPRIDKRWSSESKIKGSILMQGPWKMMELHRGNVKTCKCFQCDRDNYPTEDLVRRGNFFYDSYSKSMRSLGYDPSMLSDSNLEGVGILDETMEVFEAYLNKESL